MNEKQEKIGHLQEKVTDVLPIASLSEESLSFGEDDIVAVAERRLSAHKKILEVALKITQPADWVDIEGRPYLTGSGAEKVASLFGVEIPRKDQHGNDLITCEKEWGEDEKGRYYFYTVTGVARLKGYEITAIGTCSSRDQFFAKVRGQWRSLSEVDETNIKKAAYTNFIVNAITRILGLRNLTWDQVEAQGISRNKVGRIEYDKKPNTRLISEAQHKRLIAISTKAGVTTDEIKERFGLASTKDITQNQYDEIVTWVERGGKSESHPPSSNRDLTKTFFELLNPYIDELGFVRVKNACRMVAHVESPEDIKDTQQQQKVIAILEQWKKEKTHA